MREGGKEVWYVYIYIQYVVYSVHVLIYFYTIQFYGVRVKKHFFTAVCRWRRKNERKIVTENGNIKKKLRRYYTSEIPKKIKEEIWRDRFRIYLWNHPRREFSCACEWRAPLYRLKIPPALFLDWIGKITTSEIPNPTVRPTLTDINWSAVLKPDR